MNVSTRRKGREDGFILIIVIWMTALFALVTAGFVRAVQAHLRNSTVQMQSARAEMLADSGLSLATLDLIETRANKARSRRFLVDGSLTVCSLGGEDRLSIRLQDTGGKINLNTAGDRLLQAFFIGLGASRADASRYSDVILDFRDQDDDRRPAGAEKPEYLAAGRPLGPKNAPLDSLEELHQILGLDAAIIEAMLPHVTLHSGTAGLDPEVTPPVLADLLARGAEGLATRPQSGFADRLPVEFIIASPQRVYAASVTAQLANGTVFVREAVIELQANRNGLPIHRVWKRGAAAPDLPSLDGSAMPPC